MVLRALSLLCCIVLASVAFAGESPHIGVIGAGYAGLTAALELRHLGCAQPFTFSIHCLVLHIYLPLTILLQIE
jgi:threonine dehydrogenase-like Zn-dependent dehydrogenase